MDSALPSPPATRESTPQFEVDSTTTGNLGHRLDELLEQYLEILDEYTILREELSKTFSNGFMSLAHAQRTSNLGPGRRYGQDGYDSRMKASRRVGINQSDNEIQLEPHLTVSKSSLPIKDETTPVAHFGISTFQYTPKADMDSKVKQQSNSILRNGDSKKSLASSKGLFEKSPGAAPEVTGEARKEPKIDPAYRNPITWYGILVPPALRQAQSSFSSSVETSIPGLLSAVNRLESLESQIRAMRASLGTKQSPSNKDTSSLTIRSAEDS